MMSTIRGAKILSFGSSRTTGSESDTSNHKMLYQPINAVARQTESKACVCGTPLSFRIDQPLSTCCTHNPSPLESSNNKMCMWICVMFMWLWLWLCVCPVTVTVLVVVVVVVVMVGAVIVLCVFCDCCVHCGVHM